MIYKNIKANQSFISNGIREFHFDCPECNQNQVVFETDDIKSGESNEYRIDNIGKLYPIFVCQTEGCNFSKFIRIRK